MAITVYQSVLRSFRKAAWRAFPREYVAALYGKVDGSTLHIVSIVPVTHSSTQETIDIPVEEIELAKDHAASNGLTYLGTIHSHPNRSVPEPSLCDLQTTPQYDPRVMGIAALYKCKSRRYSKIAFFHPQPPFTQIIVR